MLLQNATNYASNPITLTGGTLAGESIYLGLRDQTFLNTFAGQGGIQGKSSIPLGHTPGEAWFPSIQPGGLVSRRLDGDSSLVGAVAGGVNGQGILAGSGNITQAQASLIVSALSSLLGSGTITGTVNAVLPMVASVLGSGDFTAAIRALADLLSAVSGAGDVSPTIRATGKLEGAITVAGEVLSTTNVAEAVWSALAEGNFSYAQCMQIIAAASAGKTSNSGQTFRDLSDTKNRISGTVAGGERTAVTYDLD